MAFHLRTTGRLKVRSVALGRRPVATLLVTGLVALVAGASILGASLAPMFGIGTETATVLQTAAVPWADNPSGALTLSGSIADRLNTEALPAMVDHPIDGVAFEMRIPELHYSAKVLEGIDKQTLDRGPGHYPNTAWPGRSGTVGIAAHNVYWLSFNRLKVGDVVELQTIRGLFAYEITGSKVTVASDVTVLQPTQERRLALTTCYPLWAGALATERLVFTAREIGGVA